MKRKRTAWWVGAICMGLLFGCGGAQKAVTSTATKSTQSVSGSDTSSVSTAASSAEAKASVAQSALDDKDVKGDVIAVTLNASKDLNTFNNQPHTLVLVFYQLSQSSVFAQFLDTPEGKAKLLSGDSFDGSVLSRRRLVVQPGETQRVILDRVEGAKYLGAVAGYYNVQTEDMSRVVPVVREMGGVIGFRKIKPQIVRFTLGRSGFAQ